MSLRADLERRVLANDEARGWTRVLFEKEHYAHRPPLTPGRSMLTGFGGIDVAKKIRFIYPEHWPVADTELAQMYLTVCRTGAADEATGGTALRAIIPSRKPYPAPWPTVPTGPSFMRPFGNEHYVAVDFVSCYARLYLGLTPDCFFAPEREAFMSGRIEWWRRDEWLALKGPRNRAWGLMCKAPGTKMRSTTFAPHLTSFSMHALAAIAHVARDTFGAVYWRGNDEVWLPAVAVSSFREWCREAWKMELHESKEAPTARPSRSVQFDHVLPLSPSQIDWLAETWRWSDANRARAQLSSGVRTAKSPSRREGLHVLQATHDSGSAA